MPHSGGLLRSHRCRKPCGCSQDGDDAKRRVRCHLYIHGAVAGARMNSITISDVFGLAAQPEQLTWEPFRIGIMLSRVHGDPAAAPAAAWLRYEPGASAPPHEHVGWEYIFVVSGSQRDDKG